MTAEAVADGLARRTVTARASAKVNLHLAVGRAREDGYHPLATVFQAVDMYETVTATVRDDSQITLAVTAAAGFSGSLADVPLDATNLAWRAAEALRERYGIADGVDLEISKGVPIAGGMAGGSADAAAALVACNRLWECGATRDELADVAAELGADVPFALLGHTAVGTGRGDVLSPAMAHGSFHWVFALQHEGLSTPAVFARFDQAVAEGVRLVPQPAVDEEVMAALMAGDPFRLGTALRNDLEASALALMPKLKRVIDECERADALGVIVSGSGPTVAALAASRIHAQEIAALLRSSGTADAVVCASGPATGAVVLER